jgi:hypothetical protein
MRRIDDLDAEVIEMLYIARCQRGAASERYAGDHTVPKVPRRVATLPSTHEDCRLLSGRGVKRGDAALQRLVDEAVNAFTRASFRRPSAMTSNPKRISSIVMAVIHTEMRGCWSSQRSTTLSAGSRINEEMTFVSRIIIPRTHS